MNVSALPEIMFAESGLKMRRTIIKTSLGWLSIAATDKGICTIDFGEDPDVLQQQLAIRFFKAVWVEPDDEFMRWAEAVAELVEAPLLRSNLPLDIRGSAFQQKVWKGLQEIHPGSTVSYTELAVQLGMPAASRAVAGACAANRLAVVIPCHRVVGKDGALRGYRWGLERKQALIARESVLE